MYELGSMVSIDKKKKKKEIGFLYFLMLILRRLMVDHLIRILNDL